MDRKDSLPTSTDPGAVATGKRKRLRENIGDASNKDEMEVTQTSPEEDGTKTVEWEEGAPNTWNE